MKRRAFLKAVGVAGVGSLSGCLGILENSSSENQEEESQNDNQNTDTDVSDSGDSKKTKERETGWHMHQHDSGNSGHNPESKSPSQKPSRNWVYDAGIDVEYIVASTENVYAGGEVISSVNAETGEQKWVTKTGTFCTPAVVDGNIYFGSERLRVVKKEAGGEIWSSPVEENEIGRCEGLTVDGGDIYCVYSYQITRDSEEERQFDLFRVDTSSGKAESIDKRITDSSSVPTVVDGKVYILDRGEDEKFEVGIKEVSSSEKLYTVEEESTAPIESDGYLYSASKLRSGYKVYAYNLSSGSLEWTAQGDGGIGPRPETPAVANGKLYLYGPSSQQVKAFDTEKQEEAWSSSFLSLNDRITTELVVANGTLYFGSKDGMVYAYETSSGQEKWKMEMDAEVHSVVPANDAIYVGAGTKLHSFS